MGSTLKVKGGYIYILKGWATVGASADTCGERLEVKK